MTESEMNKIANKWEEKVYGSCQLEIDICKVTHSDEKDGVIHKNNELASIDNHSLPLDYNEVDIIPNNHFSVFKESTFGNIIDKDIY